MRMISKSCTSLPFAPLRIQNKTVVLIRSVLNNPLIDGRKNLVASLHPLPIILRRRVTSRRLKSTVLRPFHE